MTYNDYVQRIRNFRRGAVLVETTTAIWRAWEIGSQPLPDPLDKEVLVIRAYAARLFSISAATGNENRNPTPFQSDILLLCNRTLEVNQSVSDSKFIAAESEKIVAAFRGSKTLSKYVLLEDLAHVCAASLFLQRLLSGQWDAANYSIRHPLRSWMIFKHLDNRLGGKPSGAIKRIFRQEPIHALRSALLLYFLATKPKDKKIYSGLINIDHSNVEDKMKNLLEIDLETIRLMGQRMSTPIQDYRKWHDNQVKSLPEYYRVHAPLPLYQSPLLPAGPELGIEDLPGRAGYFFCPSPYIFMASVSDLFFRELRTNPRLMEMSFDEFSDSLGKAIEDYLDQDCLPVIFQDCKITKTNENEPGEKADFIIETEPATFVIESKNTIGNAEARTVFSPEDVVSIWERLLKSYSQCASTIRKYKKESKTDKPVIGIVVVSNNTVVAEQSIFDLVAHHSGVFKAMELEYIEVMSLDAFERLFQFSSYEDVSRVIVEKWNKSRQSPVMNNFHSIRTVPSDPNRKKVLTHIDDSLNELFPGIKNRFESVDPI